MTIEADSVGRARADEGAASRSPAAMAASSPRPFRLRHAACVAMFVAGYIALDAVSAIHEQRPLAITLWNPPPALSLFVMCVLGPAYAAAAWLAAVAADGLVRGFPIMSAATWLSNAALAGGYLVVALALRRVLLADPEFREPARVFSLMTVALGGAAVVATAYVASLTVLIGIDKRPLLQAAFDFWIGDATGIAVLGPICALLATSRRHVFFERRFALEQFGIGLALVGALWLVFGAGVPRGFQFFYLFFLPVGWSALRWGLPGAALMTVMTQIGVVLSVNDRLYSFDQFRDFQIMVLALAAAGIVLGAVVEARRRAETLLQREQSRRAELAQIASLGALGSALAHELSQPISSAAAYVAAARSLLTAEPPVPGQVDGILDKVSGQIGIAAERLQRLRDLIGSRPLRVTPIALGTAVAEVLRVLGAEMEARDIQLNVRSELDAGDLLQGNREQIELLIAILFRNAIDALDGRERRDRRLDIVCHADGDQLVIAVTDNGPGVDASVLPDLFDPFVTTKASGMGLGLAIARTMVGAHRGTLSHERPEGGGARFVARFPRVGPGVPGGGQA